MWFGALLLGLGFIQVIVAMVLNEIRGDRVDYRPEPKTLKRIVYWCYLTSAPFMVIGLVLFAIATNTAK